MSSPPQMEYRARMEYLRLRDEEEAHLRRQVGQKEAKKLAEGKFRVSRSVPDTTATPTATAHTMQYSTDF